MQTKKEIKRCYNCGNEAAFAIVGGGGEFFERAIKSSCANCVEDIMKMIKQKDQLWYVLFAEQRGCCALCNRYWKETGQGLVLDHDHKTGKIRGLLCMSCNSKLGYFEKEIGPMISYILKPQEDIRY